LPAGVTQLPKAQSRFWWAIGTVLALTLILRPPLAVIGPLLGNIRADLGLTVAQAGVLTALPVLCFGAGAFAGPVLLRRFGLARTFSFILVLMTVTLASRAWLGFGYFLTATVALGVGIALSNVLFPTLILAEFPGSVPRMTAVYTTLLSVFAALASGVAYPLSQAVGGWKPELTLLAIPGFIGFFIWRKTTSLDQSELEAAPVAAAKLNLWGHPLAWALSAFFGLQSAIFYVLLNWLPSILVAEGIAPTTAGVILAYLSSIGVPIGLILTANLGRLNNLTTLLVAAISAVTASGLFLLLAGPAWVWVAATLIGCGLSSSFPLSLALIGMKGGSQRATTSLSSIAQGIGYLVAAAAVFLAGVTGSGSSNWTPVIFALTGIALIQGFAGSFAAKHVVIE